MQEIETQWLPPPNENDDGVYDEPAEVLQLMLFPAIACIVLYSAGVFCYLLRSDTIDEHARRDDIVTDTHDFNYLMHRVLEHGKSDILTLSNADLIHQMAGELRDLKKLQLDTLLMLDPIQARLDARSLHKKYEKCEGRHLDHDGRFGPKGFGWNIHKPGKPDTTETQSKTRIRRVVGARPKWTLSLGWKSKTRMKRRPRRASERRKTTRLPQSLSVRTLRKSGHTCKERVLRGEKWFWRPLGG